MEETQIEIKDDIVDSDQLSANAQHCIETLASTLSKLKTTVSSKKEISPEILFSTLNEPEWLACKDAVYCLLREVDFTMAFANSGIPQGSSFSEETFRIVKDRLLPYVHGAKDARTIIRNVISTSSDHKAIAALFDAWTEIPHQYSIEQKEELLSAFRVQATNAAKMISYLVAALGMHEDIHERAGKEEELITPFMEQNREMNELLTSIETGNKEKATEDLAQMKVMMTQCRENILLLDKAAEKNGASLSQTFLLRKLESLLTRLTRLLPIVGNDNVEEAFGELSFLIREVILVETNRQRLRYFVGRNINLLAYRITENKRKSGEHYIAADKKEYWTLFRSACGGGFVVSFLVIIKLLLHMAHLPPLWESLLYSLNYSIGFVILYMYGYTLATKQPAVTAAYIAASLDEHHHSSKYEQFAATIARISRSQLVSFAGNLLVVFPVTLLWITLLGFIFRRSIIDEEEGRQLLLAIHPVYSLSFLYASIAGFFLFISGIISGFGDNKAVVSHIGLRLQSQPLLKRLIRPDRLKRFALYIEHNMGALLGNISLGFFLGMSTFVGKITGLPFDIRHITFSMGNMGLGFYGMNFQIDWSLLLVSLLGIVIIGIFNFFVSFSLALEVAARSRSMRLMDHLQLLLAVLKYFLKHPMDFVYPPKEEVELPQKQEETK